MNPVFRATVEKDKLKFETPDQFSLWLGQFIGKTVEVIVRKVKRPRSTGKPYENGNQNGYYRGVIIPISAKCLGYTEKEMHEVFIEEYAPYRIVQFKEKQIKVRIRTSEMDTVQMSEFTDNCIRGMAELNCVIPEPQKIISD
jgi:hypothetical protein